jgi:hypothetical protein
VKQDKIHFTTETRSSGGAEKGCYPINHNNPPKPVRRSETEADPGSDKHINRKEAKSLNWQWPGWALVLSFLSKKINEKINYTDLHDLIFILYQAPLNLIEPFTGRHLLPKDTVNSFSNGHVGIYIFIDLKNTFTGIVSLCDHIHFQLR